MVVAAFDAGSIRALYGSRWKLFEGVDIEVNKYPYPTFTDKPSLRAHWNRNNGKAITVYLLPEPLQTGSRVRGCSELWNDFMKLFNLALEFDEVKTIGVDTMTLARRIANNSHLQDQQWSKPDKLTLGEFEYTRPNDLCRSLYMQVQNLSENRLVTGKEKHLVVVHHLRPIYVNRVVDGVTKSVVLTQRQPNGSDEVQYEMEGLTGTYRFVDVAIRMEKFLWEDQDEAPVNGRRIKHTGVRGTFRKCGFNLSLEQTQLISPTWDTIARVINKELHPRAKIELRGALNADVVKAEAEAEAAVVPENVEVVTLEVVDGA